MAAKSKHGKALNTVTERSLHLAQGDDAQGGS